MINSNTSIQYTDTTSEGAGPGEGEKDAAVPDGDEAILRRRQPRGTDGA